MPLFSVIIPCRNAAGRLGETIASVEAQSLTDWEAVVIDDGSTDATGRILLEWARRDSRVRVLSGPGAGPGAARNLGARAATGEILAFLDADDLWRADRLKMLAGAFAQRPGTAAFFGRVAFFSADPAQPETFSRLPGGSLTIAQLLCENAVCTTSNLAVRRAAFLAAPFREDMRHAEDVEQMIRLLAGGMRIEPLDATLTFYRMSPLGLSSDVAAMEAGWRRCVDSAKALGALPAPGALRAAEAAQMRYLARRALRLDMSGGVARRYALRGLRAAPRAFLSPVRRGGAVLAAALLAPFMPRALRRALFSG